MSGRWLIWWRARTHREQRLLLAMFALLGVTILWFGLYRPLTDGLSSARARYARALISAADTRGRADAARALARLGAPPAGMPLGQIVGQSADQAGFAGATVVPQGARRVTLTMPSARPPAFFAWIAGLETRDVFVERLSAKANADSTLAIDATLAGRSR